jgi:hypothetical protein
MVNIVEVLGLGRVGALEFRGKCNVVFYGGARRRFGAIAVRSSGYHGV